VVDIAAFVRLDADKVFLNAADAAGSLHELTDGVPAVLGETVDPATGRSACLVEYCPADHLSRPDGLARLRRVAAEAVGDVPLIVRAPGEVRPHGDWARLISYVWRWSDRGPDRAAGLAGWTIGQATGDDDEFVADCLVEAIEGGYSDLGQPAHRTAVEAAVTAILTDDSRVSYLARVDGAQRGHATLLTGAYDDVSGAVYDDLVDMLVRPGPDSGLLRAALVEAAQDHAGRDGRALVGNVTHPAPGGAAAEHAEQVLRRLLDGGWHRWYSLWVTPRRPSCT